MDLKQYLKDYDQAYEDAEMPDGTGGALPDGKHTATITDSQIEEATWGSVQWSLRFENDQGSVRKWNALDVPERLGYVKADLAKLGYTGKLSDLDPSSFVGAVCEITVQRKVRDSDGKVFTNVYLNADTGRQDSTVTAREPVPVGQSDDDIPF